jgi:sulfur-oxidizing protein SoxB
MNRREFIHLLTLSGMATGLAGCSIYDIAGRSNRANNLYDVPTYGQVRLLHITDTHGQLNPIYFREPNVNIGVGNANNRVPHRVGKNLLNILSEMTSEQVHAFTYLNFAESAAKYGKVGGFAHLKTLIDRLRDNSQGSLLLDGGDTWQGSGTALWTRGKDMVGACNMLGVDVMTGHWEFTYSEQEIRSNINDFNGDFVAQNIQASEDALFDGVEVFDEDTGHVFPPYVIKVVNGKRLAVIGQAFPYTPIANPSRNIPNWRFGIQEIALQELIEKIKQEERPDGIVLLSHNGMDVDLKLASRVSGIDVILGGHTHDGVPEPIEVKNSTGMTLVTNAGSNGKFVGVVDLDFGQNGLQGYQYNLLPVFSRLIPENLEMQNYIDEVRAPYKERLQEELAVTGDLLYRRGNFNGSFDQVICDALIQQLDAEISLSPGFRWGTSVLPGETITMDRLLDQTSITYPETYVRLMKGGELKSILESVADNLFNPDPYFQQGGDMVRTGGVRYACEPNGKFGKRITELRTRSGDIIEENKNYKVAGWATVGSQSSGAAVWEPVAEYLRDKQVVHLDHIDVPKLVGVGGNLGLADLGLADY